MSIETHRQVHLLSVVCTYYFDTHCCFPNLQGSVRQKRDSSNLFGNSSNRSGRGDDNLMSKLLREKGSLNSSLQSINDVINQAFEAKNSLLNQRGILQGSASGLTGLVGEQLVQT